MSIYTCIYIHTYTFTLICTAGRVAGWYKFYTYTHTHIYVYVFFNIYTHMHMYICIYILIHAYNNGKKAAVTNSQKNMRILKIC